MGLDDVVAPWTVVIPVKSLAEAKSRLADGVDAPSALALAFLGDTLEAVAAAPAVVRIVVVTSDPVAAATAAEHGAVVVDDRGHPGINAAAAAGAEAARADGTAVAVIVSDLPCLTPRALATVLELADGHPRSFLADRDGSGTTMWLAGPDQPVGSRFGAESRAAHRADGVVDLVDQHPEAVAALLPARTDVDTVAALEQALAVGVGPRTRAAAQRRTPA